MAARATSREAVAVQLLPRSVLQAEESFSWTRRPPHYTGSMSLDALRAALEALDEPAHCGGDVSVDDSLAIALPGGDVARVSAPDFVAWLLERSESAPFGQGGVTRIDRDVRDALRLRARGDARVVGFDPEAILDEVESALSPRERLAAELTDVVVYPVGGHFLRHKDTPRSPDLIGTLVVGLPIAHTGGAFEVNDGDAGETFDWSGPADPTRVRWAAFYGDVDHAVAPVTAGARVTLVYALLRTGRDRADPDWSRRFAAVDACVRRLTDGDLPLMIPCTRLAVCLDDATVLSLDVLRGADRELADALTRAGLTVRVRACLAARDREDGSDASPPQLTARWLSDVAFARLARPLTEADLAGRRPCVTFVAPVGDGGGYFEHEVTSWEALLDAPLPAERWLVRRTAAATLVSELEFAGDGYVGNAAYEAFLYRLAALEVTRRA